jgi:hypothetical protein
MFRRWRLSGGSVGIVVRGRTARRLDQTCFRGRHLALAGNFSRWASADELFDDTLVLRRLFRDMGDADDGTNRMSIRYHQIVGWASVDQRIGYPDDALEEFHPNSHSVALRLRLDRPEYLAPRTDWLTIVYELKHEDIGLVAVIHSIYPGDDIGELDGDITEREGCVFFSWQASGVTADRARVALPDTYPPRNPTLLSREAV